APAARGQDDFVEVAREYLYGLRRRWKLALAVAALGLAGGAVHFFVTPPSYSAQTTILIERRSANSLLSNQFPWLDQYFNLEFYPTQYRLLQSRGLAEQVVRDLELVEGTGPATAIGEGDASAAGDRAAVGRMAERLLAGLSVQPIRETQLVEISYRSDDAEQASRVANAFARAFIDFSIRTRSETMSQTSDVLAEQIQRFKDEVVDLENRLASFSDQDQVLSFTPEGNVSLQRIEQLNTELMTAMRERIDEQASYQELVGLPDEVVADRGAGTVVGQLRSELATLERDYQARLEVYKEGHPDMQALEARIEQARQHLGEVVADEARRVRRTAWAGVQAAQREEQALSEEIRQLKERMAEENPQAVEFSSLQVELRTRRELLDDLLRRQSETVFVTRLQTDKSSNVRVIDEALVPSSPTYPSLRSDLSAGAGAGLLLGIGLGLLLQFLDRTIKSADELERLLRLPVLAVIPDLGQGARGSGYAYREAYGGPQEVADGEAPRRIGRLERRAAAEEVPIELLPHVKPRLAAAEAYRSLRTALLLSAAHELKVLAVTSVEAAEGKTATAANLAVVLAQLGRRVVLLDADLRKPRIHKVFGVSNRAGLVTYLTTGSDQGIVHRTDVGGLFVVPSGPIPPNPSELLASDRMRELIGRLRESFDYVVFDTPPALAVTDSTIVGSIADGVVLCVRSGQVDRRDAGRALERLRMADVRVLGAVLNAHRAGGGSGYYRYYEAYAAPEAEREPAA
ncbi:MAG TPA: polysaccharide biosynthesis tyrosine autokinase, partial [Thermoanaerobaculia bacterium]|nr:polysaccharide biosynthesis tyrosine autokinase [Thermoanaerobaculia bacterium]